MYEHMFNNTFLGYSNVKVRFRVSNSLDPDQDHGPSVLIWIETVLKGYQQKSPLARKEVISFVLQN